ncbi:MAG: TMEM175 family protein [Fimbriimonadaceae bacterium]
MSPTRLEAFSDGVLAIIITIMVLEIRPPEQASLAALGALSPILLGYLLSFFMVAIYWVNHHHMVKMVKSVTAEMLWSNINLLFWISLFPFGTAYLGSHRLSPISTLLYSAISFAGAVSFFWLRRTIMKAHRGNHEFALLNKQLELKNLLAIIIYLLAMACSYASPLLSIILVIVPGLMYFVPEKRVERVLIAEHNRKLESQEVASRL